jgi:hypothetical protein
MDLRFFNRRGMTARELQGSAERPQTSASIVPADLVGGLTVRNRRQLLLPLKNNLLLPLNLQGFCWELLPKQREL